ncbi:MAG: nitrate reductase cytochrome c-type subunit [Gallionella sp.]|nr:nitrate reductase cytochrome c-type subunit [Gallionella sp.]
MRYIAIIIRLFAGIGLMAACSAFAAQPVQTNSMGLSKTSVFATPTPKVYHENAAQPGASKVLPRAYLGAPPQVSHSVSDFLPITTESNMCVACHNQPSLWGQPREPGVATPIPPSHYTDLRKAPGKVSENLVGARYNCNQCHVPQTNAPALVGNSFSGGRAR